MTLNGAKVIATVRWCEMIIRRQIVLIFCLLAKTSVSAQVFVPTDSISNVRTFVGRPFESTEFARVYCVAYDENKQLQILASNGERDFTVFASATITSMKNISSTIYTLGDYGGACGWIDTVAITNNVIDWKIFPVKTNWCDTCEMRITNVTMIGEETAVFTAEEYFVRRRDTIDHVPITWVTPVSSVIALVRDGSIDILERDTINRDKRHSNIVSLDNGRLIVAHSADTEGNVLTLLDNESVVKKLQKPTELESKKAPSYLHVAKSGAIYCFFESENVGPTIAKCSVVVFDPASDITSIRAIDDIHSVRHVVDYGSGLACATSSGIVYLHGTQSFLIPSFDPYLGLVVEVFGLHKESESRIIAYTPTGLMYVDSIDWQTSVGEEVLPDGPCTWSLHNLNGTMTSSGSGNVEIGNLAVPSAGLANGIYLLVVRTADGRAHNKKLVVHN